MMLGSVCTCSMPSRSNRIPMNGSASIRREAGDPSIIVSSFIPCHSFIPRFILLPMDRLPIGLLLIISIFCTLTIEVSSNRCPFAAWCTCPDSADKVTFESASCDFGPIPNGLLKFDGRGKVYKITGELIIRGNFKVNEKSFNIGPHSLAQVFETIGKLTLMNTARKASLVQILKVDTVKGAPIHALELIGFRQFLQPLNRCNGKCLEHVKELTIKNSELTDHGKDTLKVFKGLPALTSLTIEDTNVTSLVPAAFETFNERLIELTIRNCRWNEYPTVEAMASLEKLILENNHVHDAATKTYCLFCGMAGLKELHLYGQDLEIAHSAATMEHLPPNLATVYLGTSLEEIPHLVTANKVKLLSLDNNQIKSITVTDFDMHNELTHLHLNNNPLETIEPGSTKSLATLEELEMRQSHLTTLDLSSLTSGMEQLKSLSLDNSEHLTELTISDISQFPPNLARISLTHTNLDIIHPSMKELFDRPGFEMLDLSHATLSDCDAAKWMVPYSMCDEGVKVNVEEVICTNAGHKRFVDYMRIPAKRLCPKPTPPPDAADRAAAANEEETAPPAEPEAPPAEEEAAPPPEEEVPPPAEEEAPAAAEPEPEAPAAPAEPAAPPKSDVMEIQLDLKNLLLSETDPAMQEKWKDFQMCFTAKMTTVRRKRAARKGKSKKKLPLKCPNPGYMKNEISKRKKQLARQARQGQKKGAKRTNNTKKKA